MSDKRREERDKEEPTNLLSLCCNQLPPTANGLFFFEIRTLGGCSFAFHTLVAVES